MRCLWCALFATSVFAAVPELKSFLPCAAAPGTTNRVEIFGKFDAPKFWSDPPGLNFIATSNKTIFTVEVAADAKPGPRLVRLYNNEGPSEPRFFIIDPANQLSEKEPNSRLAEAQDPGSLPIVINGRLNKNDDVDCFKIPMRKGDWLEASLKAYTLMSKFDGVLKLLATNGTTLAWNHDYETFDPHLWYESLRDQTVILQVFGFIYPANSDIRLYGGEEGNYRLHLSATPPSQWQDKTNTSTSLPLTAQGSIKTIGQEDRFAFNAEKDQTIEIRVAAASIGSPLDPWLKILDAAGKQLAQADDSEGSRDPRLEWKAPADTNYFIAVGSTLNRGSTNYHYQLRAEEVGPDFKVTWSAPSLVLTNNSTNALKFEVKRLRNHTNDLVAELRNLPDGITSTPLHLTNRSGEISLAIAVTNAPSFQGPIRLVVRDFLANVEKPALVELTTRGENNGVPNGYSKLVIESYDHLWLIVQTQAVKAMAATSND